MLIPITIEWLGAGAWLTTYELISGYIPIVRASLKLCGFGCSRLPTRTAGYTERHHFDHLTV